MNSSLLASRSQIELHGAEAKGSERAIRISYYHLGVVGWALLDFVSAFAIILASCWLSPVYDSWHGTIPTDPNFSPFRVAAVYALIFAVISHVLGMQSPLMRRQRAVMVVKYVSVAALAITLTAVVELMMSYTRIGRHILVYAFLLCGIGIPLLRMTIWRMSEERKRKVAVFGPAVVIERMQSLITTSGIPYEMVPFQNLDHVLRSSMGSSPGFWRRCGFDEIVACYTENTPREELAGLSQAPLSGVQVSDYSSFMERTFFRVPVEQIGPEWFFQLDTSGDYALYRAAKRLADLILAGAGLLLAAPALLLAGVLVRVGSDGPAFYSQVRIGQFGRPFRIWKLRSMRIDAERNGAQWAREDDARVTWIGNILRRTRLDEVPQFINVLRGEMSLVGPRPERPEFVSELAKGIPFYQQRHMLKPGITGWAQINHPYGATVEGAQNKLKYDLYYLKYASAILDLQIVLRTIGAVMKGAR